MTRCIQIFAKAPIPGKIKTRLQPALSGDDCARLSRDMIRHSIKVATDLADTSIELWCFPNEEIPFFQQLADEFPLELHTQCGVNLGDRMHHALNQALETHHAVQLIGSDCPFYSQEYLRYGFELLETPSQVVIGPATDGGYLLIGANRPLPESVFNNIAWGTNTVFRETLDRFQDIAITPRLLPSLNDIDRPEDLKHFRR